MSLNAIVWALKSAPLPKSDPTARLVLAALGEQADKQGLNAHPQIGTLAHDLTLDPKSVKRTLTRLLEFGLISKEGIADNGAVNYRLHLEVVRAGDSYDEFQRRQRRASADHKASWRRRVQDSRSRTSATVQDDGSWTVQDAKYRTSGNVQDDGSAMSRTTVPDVQDGSSLHTRRDIPKGQDTQAASRATADATPAENAPRRARKPKSPELDAHAHDIASRYYEAMQKQAHFPAVRGVIRKALDTFGYDDVRAGAKAMTEGKNRGRPLTRLTLLTAIEQCRGGAAPPGTGHAAYANATGPADYLEDL